MTHEAAVSERWCPCVVLSVLGKRLLVRVYGIVRRGEVVDDGEGVIMTRRQWQVRPRSTSVTLKN